MIILVYFLKEIILGQSTVKEISSILAFELLSHMKGGKSVEVLLDLALGDNEAIAKEARDKIKVEYEVLPPIFTVEEAMAELELLNDVHHQTFKARLKSISSRLDPLI